MAKKRKSNKKRVKKPKIILDKIFDCPFCNHEKCCSVKLDKDTNSGAIHCTICLESYHTSTHYLTEPVDVYCDWIDACEAANS
ncbi:Transcription elongation factor 1 [Intoshia linei]|uniref:Transcription elongation factor 1 homolog n=1 Tax=Intoshia linei TaxID=1819745 RepID=A0A177ASJ0_9BILA|nr:Transcription elongation factor 1 [Intoshia linei]